MTPSQLFGHEKQAFSFNGARQAASSFLQRFRRPVSGVQPIARQVERSYQQVAPQFRREVVDLSTLPPQGTLFRPSQVRPTMQMKTPVPGMQQGSPRVHVTPMNPAEARTLVQPVSRPPAVPQHVRDASIARGVPTPRASA
jgi:hypothetical protein